MEDPRRCTFFIPEIILLKKGVGKEERRKGEGKSVVSRHRNPDKITSRSQCTHARLDCPE